VTWFVLALGAAVTQATQFAVVKARAQTIPPMVITVWTPAAYVNAIRRMSAVLAVILGGAVFRESDVGRRLTAALLACAGAALLLLASGR
jgi:hypothetical protein